MNAEVELRERHCKPCKGGVDPMGRDQARILIDQVAGWELTNDGNSINRRFEFGNFHQTMAFVNALAWVAHQEDHHPDFSTGYNFCDVTYTTHAVKGLSENDFICAARINALQQD